MQSLIFLTILLPVVLKVKLLFPLETKRNWRKEKFRYENKKKKLKMEKKKETISNPTKYNKNFKFMLIANIFNVE